jgi:hypothetical protein
VSIARDILSLTIPLGFIGYSLVEVSRPQGSDPAAALAFICGIGLLAVWIVAVVTS